MDFENDFGSRGFGLGCCDATDDSVHGRQEGRFFHGYYDHYYFLPLYVICIVGIAKNDALLRCIAYPCSGFGNWLS